MLDGGFADMLGHSSEAAAARDGTLVFVDGDREPQRRALESNLAQRGLSVDLTEHGLPRVHTYLYVNWRRPSVRRLRASEGLLARAGQRPAGRRTLKPLRRPIAGRQRAPLRPPPGSATALVSKRRPATSMYTWRRFA